LNYGLKNIYLLFGRLTLNKASVGYGIIDFIANGSPNVSFSIATTSFIRSGATFKYVTSKVINSPIILTLLSSFTCCDVAFSCYISNRNRTNIRFNAIALVSSADRSVATFQK
jgi:hypothetical protein